MSRNFLNCMDIFLTPIYIIVPVCVPSFHICFCQAGNLYFNIFSLFSTLFFHAALLVQDIFDETFN
jgi:hypothetical protein